MQEQPMNVGSTAGEANNNDRGQTKHTWWFDWIKVLVVPLAAVGVSWWIGSKQIESAKIIADGQMKLQDRIARDEVELQKQTAEDEQELKRLNQITTIFEQIIGEKDGQESLKPEQIFTKIASLQVYQSTAIPFLLGVRNHFSIKLEEKTGDRVLYEKMRKKAEDTIFAILSGSQIALKDLNLKFSWCDFEILPSDHTDKTESIKDLYDLYINEFGSNKNECAVLIIEYSTNAPKEWGVAGYDDEGVFRKILIDDANNDDLAIELKIELKREKADRDKDRIIELATSMLGRKPTIRSMRFASFENYDLTGVKFENTNLFRSNFKRSRLKDVTFKNVDLTDANFSSANLKDAKFSDNTILNGTDFSNTLLGGVEFDNVKCLEKAKFSLPTFLKVEVFDQIDPDKYTRLLSNNYMIEKEKISGENNKVKERESEESIISSFTKAERVVDKVHESNLCDTQRDGWLWWSSIRQNQPMSKQALISCLEEVYETETEWCD